MSHRGLRRAWCEIDAASLTHNLRQLRHLLGESTRLGPVVKSNAYGHGTLLAARAFLDAGADWLCCDSLHEAAELRDAGLSVPIFILGYVPPEHDDVLLGLGDCRLVLYDAARAEALGEAARRADTRCPVHVKLETGTNRQGLREEAALELARFVAEHPHLTLEGLSTHFANIEDTTDHSFARHQIERYRASRRRFEVEGLRPPICSVSNSAALILWSEAHLDLVRPGIACYGMWPSRETFLSAMLAGRRSIELQPALTWKTRVAQVHDVPTGEFVSYGCTFQATHPTRLAVLPVGYYDGYVRALSNLAYVLIRGARAPIRGRVCMNMIMADVTDIPGVAVGDEVVLLGAQGEERISAELIADWSNTINYEVTTRIHPALPRIAVS